MSDQVLNDRYPGIRSFEKSERRVFFGREQETESLYSLVKTKTLTVMFAKSGLGKSSLINAGLLPLLEADRYFPVAVRFQNTGASPLDIFDRVLAWYLDHDRLNKFVDPEKAEIWHKIKACKFGERQVPIFVFDQFEEFFNHAPTARQEFVRQLADLADYRLPESALAALQAIPRSERTAEQLEWYAPAEVKFLIALRSDRLSELNEMTSAIPSVLQNRFELRPLTSAQAQLAIEKPALLEGDFSSPKFSYQPETLRDMLENLRSPKADEIESFQLQILCGEIEKKVRTRVSSLSPDSSRADAGAGIFVSPDYLGGREGIRQILNNYYENQISAIENDDEERNARRLIEEQLIADNKRVGVAVETVKLPPVLIEKLLLSRLIRRAPTHLGDVFEISHDTLVEPIAKSRDLRRQDEEKARLEAERIAREREMAEQAQRLEQERQLRSRAEHAQKEAESARQDAEWQRQKVEDALEEAQRLRERAERNAGRAFWFSVLCVVLLLPLVLLYWSLRNGYRQDTAEARVQKRDQKFEDAARTYEGILGDPFMNVLFYDKKSLRDSVAECRRLAEIQKQVREADERFFDSDYFAALQLYEDARKKGFPTLDDKIENTSKIRKLSLDIYTRKAETFYEAEAFDKACENCRKALRLDPENAFLKTLLTKIEKYCG